MCEWVEIFIVDEFKYNFLLFFFVWKFFVGELLEFDFLSKFDEESENGE